MNMTREKVLANV